MFWLSISRKFVEHNASITLLFKLLLDYNGLIQCRNKWQILTQWKEHIFYYKHLYNTKNLSIILTHVNRHIPANKEPFLNQLTRVKLVHNWYRSTSTCVHVYSREYTWSACCHDFWTSLTRVVLGQNWYGFTGTCYHVNSRVHSRVWLGKLVRFWLYEYSREFTCSFTCVTGETGTVLAVRVFTRVHVFIHVSEWGNWYGSSGTTIHANSRVHSRV